MKTYIPKKTCTQIFLTAFGIHNSTKVETNQISTKKMNGETKVVHPVNGILFDHNRHEPLIHVATWMNLKNITLCERNQMQKAEYCMIYFT